MNNKTNEFYNDITKFLDNYIPEDYKVMKNRYCDCNYIVDMGIAENDINTHIFVIRHPGATRGQIFVNESTKIITFIEIYKNDYVYCYTEPYDILTNKLQKFIGKNINELHSEIRK